MKKLFFLSLFFLSPFPILAGFPEGEKGLDIEKIENAFRLPCDEIGNDNCIARSLGISGCTWMFQVRDGKRSKDALNISDEVFVALMKGNNLDINQMFDKDGSIKKIIKEEAVQRISMCREATIQALPNLIKDLPEGIELSEERKERLANSFPMEYLRMFENIRRGK
tara:strand:+ start:557 stop:1057 length:501 start_codon:yes stop_codon:yes gene_type:complete